MNDLSHVLISQLREIYELEKNLIILKLTEKFPTTKEELELMFLTLNSMRDELEKRKCVSLQ